MPIETLVWGGAQITWQRVLAAVLAQLALIAYVASAARFFGR